jgi:FMN reductase
MTTRALAVVSGGLSNPSSTRLLADRLTASTVEALRSRGDDATVEVVELREHARDLADNLVTGFANQALRTAVETVTGADGLIAVTPIFSASYSGLFKTFFDVLDKESLVGKPVLLGATAGTARHSLALEHAVRPLFSYLRAITVPGPTGRWPAASTAPPASSPTWSPASGGWETTEQPARWTRSPTRRRPSRSSSAATRDPTLCSVDHGLHARPSGVSMRRRARREHVDHDRLRGEEAVSRRRPGTAAPSRPPAPRWS